MKRWLSLGLKFVLSVVLIGFLLDAIDLKKALAQLVDTSPQLVLTAILVFVFQMVLNTFRWQAVLNALNASLKFSKTFRIVYMGTFSNQILPSSVGGDAVRMFKAYKAGLPLSTSVNSVMLERLATVLGLILLVVVFQPFLLERIDGALPAWLFPCLMLVAIAGTGLLMFLDRFPETLRHWMIVRGLANLATDTRLVFLPPLHTLKVLIFVVASHINVSFSMWILALSLGLGDQLSFLDCLVIVPVVLLLSTLPISIAGWGVREGVMVAGLGFLGVPPESALVLSILFGLVVIAGSLPGGLIWLASSDHTIPQEDSLQIKDKQIAP